MKINWCKKNLSEDANLSILERICYLSGNLGGVVGLTIMGYFMLYFCTDIVGLSAAAIATITVISGLFDGVTDIIMGYIIDRTHHKKGKARIWLIRGCLPYALSVFALFCIPTGMSNALAYVWIFVFYNLSTSVFGTVINGSYNSMNSLITKNSYETGILGIFAMIGATIGSTVVGSFGLKFISLFGGTAAAWRMGIGIMLFAGLAFQIICCVGVTERARDTEQQKETPLKIKVIIKNLLGNKYWLIVGGSYLMIMFFGGTNGTSMVYYCKAVLGSTDYQAALNGVMAIPQVAAVFSALFFVKKIGKGNTFRLGAVILAISLIARVIFGANAPAQIIISAFYGIGVGLASSEILGMLADTVEYGLWKNGVRIVGSAFAVMSFAAKIGQKFGAAMVGWMVEWSGYNPNAAVQNGKTIFAINACFIYIPLICAIVMIVLMCFYDLDKKFDQILADNKANAN